MKGELQMLIIVVRTFILFILIMIVMRIMGKRQIGQLQPFELVITILISELAAIPMQDLGIPLINGIVPIFVLMFAQIILSYISLKSEKARGIICGKPDIVIEDGKIIEKELSKLHFNLNDLIEQLRVKGFPDIKDVEIAILETEGQLSVIPKSSKRPVTPQDLNLRVKQEVLPITLIIDGEIVKENLSVAKMSEQDILNSLKGQGISDFKQILFAGVDSSGSFFFQQRQKN